MAIVDYAGVRVRFTGDYAGSYECINHGRFYELPLLERIRDLRLPGTYLDVGTNIGNHALYFGLFCASERVIGFEPVPHWRARALANVAANDCWHVDVRPFGLADVAGPVMYATAYALDCLTLDEALPQVAGVTVIKMDIEGCEPRALRGGRAFFRRNRPVIYAECLGAVDDLLAAATDIGYRHSDTLGQGATPMLELVPA